MKTPPGQLQPLDTVDDFVLKARLHQGGMATLWEVVRADGTTSDGPLIMKMPRIQDGEDPATIVGFEVEQMVMPVLEGPHVPRYIARGDFTTQPYIVMERIEGPSLSHMVDRAPLPFDGIADIGQRVAHALHELHRQHLVHLNVKPSNVMLRPSGEAVLVDFGLSRHAHQPDLLEEEFSLPMGTGACMSPEQVQFVRNDPRSDLFALGVMLYHFTTGEWPFGNPTSVSGLRKRLYTDPTPPRALRPDTPPWLQEVIMRCLEVDPVRRYQTGAQLALDLLHPEQIPLTARADLLAPRGSLNTVKRWLKTLSPEAGTHRRLDPGNDGRQVELVERCPIVMVAIGVKTGTPELDRKLLATVRRMLQIESGARLAVVSVMRVGHGGAVEQKDEHSNRLHVQQLVAIKHWARPLQQQLQLDEHRLTFHVLEAQDTAPAIIEFANKNLVDHIVMGARGNSAMRRYLGSVSAQVVAEAGCSVTVVRV